MHPCQIPPDTTVNLNEIPTRDDALFPVEKAEGKELLKEILDEIDELQTRLYAESRRRILVVFQAMDTGGKDGTIRNVFEPADPQGIRVVSFKRPSEKELAHDYLWRIHREVPQNGQIVIFNRSHYEDIVAVRVRNIYSESRWTKRFRHIVEFERMLTDEGTTILKFFLHISKEEQKERLQARLDDPEKHWKFNPADLKDRQLWPSFMEAYGEVIGRTSTKRNPWYVVPADRKWYRNLIVANIVTRRLKGLEMEYPAIDYDPGAVRIED